MSEQTVERYTVEKQKVRSADIVVHGTLNKPYYEIKYQTMNGEWHLGFSSYKLEYVSWWLDNYFEIISYEQEVRNKTIDQFAEALNDKIGEIVLQHKDNLDFASGISVVWKIVDRIAEQMKEV